MSRLNRFTFNTNQNFNVVNAKPGGPLSINNTYVANCQPNGEIAEATEISFINDMVSIMKEEGIINQQQLTPFIQGKITTLNAFVQFINGLSPISKAGAIEIYNDYITNPYYGMPASGPQAIKTCKLVVYKPNNYQFATQGAVSSSTRTLKKNVDTIQSNLAGYNRAQRQGIYLGNTVVLNPSGQPAIPFIYKNKAQGCNQETQIRFQNPKSCNNRPARPTQPARPSNHYAQSPVDPLA
jgi:hypothetical protein